MKLWACQYLQKTEKPRFRRAWGGVSAELLARIASLEQEVQQLKKSKATADSFGLAKISDATDVTERDNGLVLSAWQNNAANSGSIRSDIKNIQTSLQFGTNSYRYVEHFRTEDNYYVYDPGYIEAKNGVAYVHINYVIVKEPIIGYDARVPLIINVPSPEQSIWSVSGRPHLGSEIEILIEKETNCLYIFGGVKDGGYRINFSYPIAW